MAGRVDVSVVIAAWNCAGTLEAALDTALGQDGVSVEAIVADDCSKDETAARARARGDADARVRLVQNPVNAGPAAARNRAIDAARGEWIAVLDADDAYAPGRLRRMVALGAEKGADAVLDNLREVDETGAPISNAPFLSLEAPEQWDLSRWAMDNRVFEARRCTGFLKPLIRRGFLEAQGLRYREAMRNSEDYALIADLLVRGGTVWALPEPGYLYTRWSGSTSHRYKAAELQAVVDFARDFEATHGADQDPDTRGALRRYRLAIENAAALNDGVMALQSRRPLGFLRAIAGRPRALPLFGKWLGEVIGKRLPGRRSAGT
ncbi:MAG: glycosyltransferase family 2 protein [Pseudomonadota bacterium]